MPHAVEHVEVLGSFCLSDHGFVHRHNVSRDYNAKYQRANLIETVFNIFHI
jgi:hypothetical protein